MAVAAVRDKFSVEATDEATWSSNPESLVAQYVEQKAPETAFYIVNLQDLVSRMSLWLQSCPRFEPWYQVNCNADPGVLLALNAMGCGFTCTSTAEVKSLLSLGIQPSDVIFSNPWKPDSEIKFTRGKNLAYMVFDSVSELRKLHKHNTNSPLLLHIATEVKKPMTSMSSGALSFNRGASAVAAAAAVSKRSDSASKFIPDLRGDQGKRHGANLNDVQAILEEVKALNIKLEGVSFQVEFKETRHFTRALKCAKWVFTCAKKILGYDLSVVDIGGGFPEIRSVAKQATDYSEATPVFEDTAADLMREVEAYFPEHENVRILARPARFLVNASHVLAVSVIARRKIKSRAGGNTSSSSPSASDSETHSPSLSDNDDVDHRATRETREARETKTVCNADDEFDHFDDDHDFSRNNHKRSRARPGDSFMYYLNDGLYGSFNCLLYLKKKIDLIPCDKKSDEPRFDCTLFGPTCDGVDCIAERDALPELFVGDWLYCQQMGAYTKSSATSFNGFDRPAVRYVCT